MLAGLGGVLLLRLFLEPVVFPCYVAPAAVLIGMACIAASGRLPVELVWWQAVLTVWLLLDSSRSGLWWTGAAVLVVAMARVWWVAGRAGVAGVAEGAGRPAPQEDASPPATPNFVHFG